MGEVEGHHVVPEAVEMHPGLIVSPQGPQDHDVQEMAALPVLVQAAQLVLVLNQPLCWDPI